MLLNPAQYPAPVAESRFKRTFAPPRLLKITAVVAVISLHFVTRWHASSVMPLTDRHNYERAYIYSLSIMAGRGFHDIPIPDTAAAAPVAAFLDKQTDRLSEQDFDQFLQHSKPTDANAEVDDHPRWASSRLLDHYVTAGLWRIFGIRWDVVFMTSIVMSTATCLLVFFIGRTIGGGFMPGLLAALMFTASPLEAYLTAWSLRDVSPLWFEALGFATLFCVLDRPAICRTGPMLAGSAALALVTMLGVGWRPDVMVSVAWLGGCLAVMLWRRGVDWRRIGMAAGVYLAVALCCRTAIHSLTTEPTVDAQNGFHMAAYAGFSRANLLHIEDTFQIERCDRETLFAARRREHSLDPQSAALPFLGSRYSIACRDLFLAEAQYNAFPLVWRFPTVYWRALGGLQIPGAFATLTTDELRKERLDALRPLYLLALDPLDSAARWLFLLGAVTATAYGVGRWQAAALFGVSILQVAALLAVLPEQKHLSTLQLPLSVFAGLGAWAVLRRLLPASWRGPTHGAWIPPAGWVWTVGGGAAMWLVACLAAYGVSRHERDRLIADIQTAAQSGAPAPGALHGDRVFSVEIAPNSSDDECGYLLKLTTGANPSPLVCEHLHFPQDWCWPRRLLTTHRLKPNAEQYFFVSCLQGSAYGDPRPLSCSVVLDGDAQFVSCTRVDLKHWTAPLVSTVFYEGQNSAGAPRVGDNSCELLWPNWPATRWTADEKPALGKLAKSNLYEAKFAETPGRPVAHLVALNRETGLWEMATSDGHRFTPMTVNYWGPRDCRYPSLGNFSGRGLTDIVGQFTDNAWWIGRANSNYFEFKQIKSPLAAAPITAAPITTGPIDFVGVGDFNGDGIDDLAVRSSVDGSWQVALSDGAGFATRRWGQWSASVPTDHICIGDFDGDGRSDIAGLDAKSGQWIVSRSDGSKFETSVWGSVEPGATWRSVLAGDFTGQRRSQVVALNTDTGHWTLGTATDRKFDLRPAGEWTGEMRTWPTQLARFAGATAGLPSSAAPTDIKSINRQSIFAVDPKTGSVAIATFDGQRLITRKLTGRSELTHGAYIGDFSGAGEDQVVCVTPDNQLLHGVIGESDIQFAPWGAWPTADKHAQRFVYQMWREQQPQSRP